ncbi:hypothetical protein BCV69DRAFT_113904 [Microstroma glucosiphilum]|uniref:CCHC-type domain-containing protein n=1 Tax=Pseudomicrostroma glucosiphilum TaxID=1684307 RepID=A0A316UDI4_9BASI|nr:hypothetical protein BCV69DRAFT_113904 [Pseudomicrostroma glucosiphilum]PWN23266.1 hypothetical protein BCV69DRAFT_113904 [Pseudomicrostroma glucosiphilum]
MSSQMSSPIPTGPRRESDKLKLEMIPIGACIDTDNEYINLLRNGHNVTKLNKNNYSLWDIAMRNPLSIINHDRAEGLLDGTIEGSVEAYRRYYGTPAVGNTPAQLASEKVAEQMRLKEDKELGSYLFSTLTEAMQAKLLNAGPLRLGSLMYARIKKDSTPNEVTVDRSTRTKISNFVLDVNKPFSDAVDQLNGIFQEKLNGSNYPFDAGYKVNELLRIARQSPLLQDTLSQIDGNILAGLQRYDYETICAQLVNVDYTRRMPGGMNFGYGMPNHMQGMQGFRPQQEMLTNLVQSVNPTQFNNYMPVTPDTSPLINASNAVKKIQPKPKEQEKQQTEDDGCFHCGETGHYSNDCPYKAAGNAARERFRNNALRREQNSTAAQAHYFNAWGSPQPSVFTNQQRPNQDTNSPDFYSC